MLSRAALQNAPQKMITPCLQLPLVQARPPHPNRAHTLCLQRLLQLLLMHAGQALQRAPVHAAPTRFGHGRSKHLGGGDSVLGGVT